MRFTYPIKLDTTVYIKDITGALKPVPDISKTDLATNTRFFNAAGSHVKVSGYDSSAKNNGEGTRLTNLVGIANEDLIKECPACERRKSQVMFGHLGRTTDKFRDQSNCNECRKQKAKKGK